LLVIAKSDSATAVDALSILLGREHAEAMRLVVARASSGDDERRFAATEPLAGAGTPAALTPLIDLVRREHGPHKVRAFALVSTEKRADPQVGELLRDSLHAKDPHEAIAAANALASAGTQEARDALVSTLMTADQGLLYASVRALDNYRLDDAAAAALAQAGERNAAVAPLVMRKLIAVGSPQGTRLAETALHDDDPNVAVRAMESLREIGSKASLKIIEDAVHTTEGDVRALAVRALGDSRDPRVVEIITSALDDSSADVRESVASALRAVGGDKARNALIGMTRSSDADDRVSALQSLRDETDRGAQQRIREMLRDPDSRVQQYAIYAMAGNSAGVGELRRLVLDGGVPHQLRYDAAVALQRYSDLDERTSEWLATVTDGADYLYSE
jgi:HEAT repeat protein